METQIKSLDSLYQNRAFKKTLNLAVGFAAGYAAFYLYTHAVRIFTRIPADFTLVIAILVGALTAVPLISQYQKR